MKLLYDQNLSPSLIRRLSDLFPDRDHVREVGLRDADDGAIWEYARDHGFAIVSKDSDFQHLALLRGHPPKAVCLTIGNCTVNQLEAFVRAHANDIIEFGEDAGESYLVLR